MLDFTELSVCSVLSLQPPHHVVELVEVAVADHKRAAAFAVLDGDAEAERVGEALLQRQRVGVLRALGARFAIFCLRLAAWLGQCAGDLLDLAHVATAARRLSSTPTNVRC